MKEQNNYIISGVGFTISYENKELFELHSLQCNEVLEQMEESNLNKQMLNKCINIEVCKCLKGKIINQ